jgi:3',5'-cyclic AMP phosphodiesterase CpdA
MLVVQITDTHIVVPASAGGPATARIESLSRCVTAINRLRPRPDAVVHTGDLTQSGDPAEYALARRILAPLAAPLYVVPGNRDRRRAFREAFGRDGYLPADGGFLHYTVERHAVRLVGLDSLVVGRGHGGICGERLNWIEAALAAAPERPTVVLMHHPPFDGGQGPLAGFLRADEAAALSATFRRHRQVRRVLCGHAHLAAEGLCGGILVSTMPSVATDLRQDGGPTGPEAPPMLRLHALAPQTGLISRSQFVGS